RGGRLAEHLADAGRTSRRVSFERGVDDGGAGCHRACSTNEFPKLCGLSIPTAPRTDQPDLDCAFGDVSQARLFGFALDTIDGGCQEPPPASRSPASRER